jgi:hypothetical protein
MTTLFLGGEAPQHRSACRAPRTLGRFNYKSLPSGKYEWELRFFVKELIHCFPGSRACRKAVVVKNKKASCRKPRVDKFTRIEHRLVDIDVYMGKGNTIDRQILKRIGDESLIKLDTLIIFPPGRINSVFYILQAGAFKITRLM